MNNVSRSKSLFIQSTFCNDRVKALSLVLLSIVFTLSGCGADTTTDDDVASNGTLSVAQTNWPTIHQNNATTKNSVYSAPTTNELMIESWQFDGGSVLYLLGEKYLYWQASTGGTIMAFDPANLAQGPLYTIDLDASFRTGGGLIDSNNRVWWTSDDRLVRLDEDLSSPVYSEPMTASIIEDINNDEGEFPYINGITLLPDNNILVTSVGQFSWIISTVQNDNNEYPIVNAINWQDLTLNGEKFLIDETTFSPRPIINEKGEIVIVTVDSMMKLNYNLATQNFDQEVVWKFSNLENDDELISSLAISHALEINGLVCVATGPVIMTAVQQVYCVNEASGDLVFNLTPFPSAYGAGALHTLGGVEEENWLVSIANANDGTAGIRTFDLDSGLPVSDIVVLDDISEAFVISAKTKHAYISHKTAENVMAVSAVNLATGVATEIYSATLTDTRSIFSGLAPSLSSIGQYGLYIPLPNGMMRMSAVDSVIWKGNESLGDADWKVQWGLVGWNAESNLLSNGFWGESDLDVVADPYDLNHSVLRITYAQDGVTTESGTGMLFAPDVTFSNPRKVCLSYKQLFDTDFNFGTVGGKLPGLYGFDVNSGLALDATTCAGPYEYDSSTCFSARLSYRNLSSLGYPETKMFSEVIPWMDKAECRDTWLCELPYGNGIAMKTEEPEAFAPILGQWTQIEQEISLNDANMSNGTIRVWYQGELVVDERDLSITVGGTVPISGIMFHSLFGQGFDLSQGSPIAQVSYIADVTLSDSCGK